jgi:hypothetical protein
MTTTKRIFSYLFRCYHFHFHFLRVFSLTESYRTVFGTKSGPMLCYGLLLKCLSSFLTQPLYHSECFAQLATSTSSRSSISELDTKTLTSTLNLLQVHLEPHMWEKTKVDGTRKLKCDAVPILFSFTKPKQKRKAPTKWVVCIRISICLYYIFGFFYLTESMYFYLSLIQVKAFANGLCI